MRIKEFAQHAIKNGYRKNGICAGWDWIEENLSELDYIFQTEEYKKQNGMQYRCMPLLTQNNILTGAEEDAIETAWYLNNKRSHKKAGDDYSVKMLAEGYKPLTEEAIREAASSVTRLYIVAKTDHDWFNTKIAEVFKPFVSADNKCYLMKPRATRTGFYWTHLKNAFYKEERK